MGTQHLQTEKPIIKFEDWHLEVVTLFADAWKIDKPMAAKKLSIDGLKEWYDDGFTPYVTFRETYVPLY